MGIRAHDRYLRLEELAVCPTSDRDFEKEYILQMNPETMESRFPHTSEGDFLLLRNTVSTSGENRRDTNQQLQTETHARVRESAKIDTKEIGLDFTLRAALGAPSNLEVTHGEAEERARIEVESFSNPETDLRRLTLNRLLGVRPQLCRVRMGVFPDLEDKICRLPKNVMEIIGVEEGENVTIESTRGEKIVRGVKAFRIDDERRKKKKEQKERDSDRYPFCEDLLGLYRIRRTEVDVPEIWIDEEARVKLGLNDLPKSGVCQPVRVYRDTWYLFRQTAHQFAVPGVIALIAAGLQVQNQGTTAIFLIVAVFIWVIVLIVEHRSRLS